MLILMVGLTLGSPSVCMWFCLLGFPTNQGSIQHLYVLVDSLLYFLTALHITTVSDSINNL